MVGKYPVLDRRESILQPLAIVMTLGYVYKTIVIKQQIARPWTGWQINSAANKLRGHEGPVEKTRNRIVVNFILHLNWPSQDMS